MRPFSFIKPILNYDGYYISDNGKVYCRLGKGNRDKNKLLPFEKMYEIKPRLTKNGYARVYMRNTLTNKREDKYIHRLVAENFIDNPENKKYVNHKNYIRNDNDISNLEWSTSKENWKYSFDNNHLMRDEFGRFISNFNYPNQIV